MSGRFRARDADRRQAPRAGRREHARAPRPNVGVGASGRHGAGSLGRTFSVSDLAKLLGLPPTSLLTLDRGADRGRHRARARRPALLSARSDPRGGAPCVRAVGPPGPRPTSRRRVAGQRGIARRGRASARCERRAGRRGRDRHAPDGRGGAGDDRSRGERRPQPAGSRAGARDRHPPARPARRPDRDVTARGGTDRGGEGVRGSRRCGRYFRSSRRRRCASASPVCGWSPLT